MTLVPPPISRSQFRNRPISKTADFETGVAVRGLSVRATEAIANVRQTPRLSSGGSTREVVVSLNNPELNHFYVLSRLLPVWAYKILKLEVVLSSRSSCRKRGR